MRFKLLVAALVLSAFIYTIPALARQQVTESTGNERVATQRAADDKILREYFVAHNITPFKTRSGLYYTVSREGSGNDIIPGQTVNVMYTGRTLDGKIFDSNTGRAPFSFKIGSRQVIDAWEIGIPLLKRGSTATLYCPSGLAYGSQAAGAGIPPNAILIFDVEIVSIK